MMPGNGEKPNGDLFEDGLELPEHLEWEVLEGGIVDRMSIIRDRRRKRRGLWLFLFGGVVMATVLYLLWPNDVTPVADDLRVEQTPTSATVPQKGKSALIVESKPAFPKAREKKITAAETNRETAEKGQSKLHFFPLLATKEAEISNAAKSIDANPIDAPIVSPRIKEDARVTELRVDQAGEPAAVMITNQLPRLPIFRLPTDVILPELETIVPAFRKRPGGQHRLLLTAGLNRMQPNYSGPNDAYLRLRQLTEVAEWGEQVDLGYERSFSNGLLVGTGLQYQRGTTRLGADVEATIGRLQTNVLVRYNVNPLTLDTTDRVFVDTSLTVIQQLRVRHFNRHLSLEIPIYLGFEFGTKRLRVGLQAGLSTSFYRRSNGRVLNRQLAISEIGEQSGNTFHRGLSFAAIGGATANYRLKRNIGLLFRVNYKHILNSNLDEGANLRLRPSFLQSSTGLYFAF